MHCGILSLHALVDPVAQSGIPDTRFWIWSRNRLVAASSTPKIRGLVELTVIETFFRI